jgi:hypothetical protein
MYSDALTGTLSKGVLFCVYDHRVEHFCRDMCFVSLIIVNELSV